MIERSGHAPRVVYGVTVGVSALKLLRGQLHWLRERGWDVTLVSTPDDAAKAAAEREGVALEPLVMSRSISPVSDIRALRQWLRLLGRIQPAAVNMSTPKAGLLGGVAACIRRVPRRVYVVRGLRLEGSRGVLALILWVTEWLAMRVATDVIFVSPSLAREASRRRLFASNKSWLIGAGSSNGVDASAIEERLAVVDRAELRARLDLGTDDFVVGFIGRIARDKGLETLIRAFLDRRLDDRVRLLCIGSTEDAELAAEVSALGERVRMVPWTDDVWGHLPGLDVLCLPTLREGFPNVVLEAAAAGVPAITTCATGAIDSVVDAETGFLIEVGDAAALVEKINQLADSSETTARLGAAAQQRARDDFRPERIWQGVAEILSGFTAPSAAERVAVLRSNGEAK